MLNRHNLDIAKLCSKEESRYTLQAIQVTPTDTRVTDGHCAMIVTRPDAKPEDFPVIDNVTPDAAATFLLDSKTALEVSKSLPKNGNFPILHNALVGTETASGKRPIAVTDMASERIFQARPSAGNFPNMDMIFPNDTPLVQLCLNADLLASLLGQIKAMMPANKNAPFLLTIYDDEKQVRLDATTSDGQQVSAVIMPMEGGNCGIVPRVFGAPEEAAIPEAVETITEEQPAEVAA